MISRYTYNTITWVDIESPSKEEILHIMETYHLPDLVGEELVSSTLRSKVELHDDLIYMILHFPVTKGTPGRNVEQEIDFVITKNTLITVRYEKIEALESFSKFFETQAPAEKIKGVTHGGYLFVELMKALYRHSLHELDIITNTIREIEYCIFNGQEEAMVRKISHTSRKLLDFKQALRFHEDVLHSYETVSKRSFGADYEYVATVATSEFNKVSSLLESNRDALSELQRTNDSLLSTKQNDTMKTLTVMTFVMMPLTIIVGVFGMNTVEGLIFIQDKADFFFIIGAMIFTGFTMYIFFKIRKWL